MTLRSKEKKKKSNKLRSTRLIYNHIDKKNQGIIVKSISNERFIRMLIILFVDSYP